MASSVYQAHLQLTCRCFQVQVCVLHLNDTSAEAPLPQGCTGALRARYGARTPGATSARSTAATAAGGSGADPRLCTAAAADAAAPSASAGAPRPRAPGACAAAAAAAQRAAAACSARNSSSTSFLRGVG